MKHGWQSPRNVVLSSIALTLMAAPYMKAQTSAPADLAQQVQQLTEAMARTQAQLEQSQHQLDEMRRQLTALQQQLAKANSNSVSPDAAAQLAAQVEDLRERQAMQESQIATQQQAKVESESKYPVKLSGLILMNGFVNTQKVDMAATPTLAIGGPGSTGGSVRQTWLGLDASGPHLFGARTYADVHVDFYGTASSTNSYVGGYSNIGLVRLQTAHAGMDWQTTQAYFLYDRPIVNPNTPNSLTAVAIPALAWSGNLWYWNPQAGATKDFWISPEHALRMQAALINVSDPPAVGGGVYPNTSTAPTIIPPSTAEQSRWPGVETRFALLGEPQENKMELGVGGYFAPHRTFFGTDFDSWAATLDYRQPLPGHLQLSGSFYRGLALGGLGGGEYKDFAYQVDPDNPDNFYFRALDDVGGWVQMQEHPSERLESNAAFGMDDVPAGELRPYADTYSYYYQNLARNRSFTTNVIYSPTRIGSSRWSTVTWKAPRSMLLRLQAISSESLRGINSDDANTAGKLPSMRHCHDTNYGDCAAGCVGDQGQCAHARRVSSAGKTSCPSRGHVA